VLELGSLDLGQERGIGEGFVRSLRRFAVLKLRLAFRRALRLGLLLRGTLTRSVTTSR
jgi:hypothetical protein